MPSGQSAPPPGPLASAIADRLHGELAARADRTTRSKEWLAAQLGTSRSNLHRKLAGERVMTLNEFLDMCDAIGCDPAAVIDNARARLTRTGDTP